MKTKRLSNPQFLQYITSLYAMSRSKRMAYSKLKAYWFAGVSIPGYEGQNKQPNMPIPRGWSYSTISRLLSILPKATLKMERRGDTLCLVAYAAGAPLCHCPVSLPSPPVLL